MSILDEIQEEAEEKRIQEDYAREQARLEELERKQQEERRRRQMIEDQLRREEQKKRQAKRAAKKQAQGAGTKVEGKAVASGLRAAAAAIWDALVAAAAAAAPYLAILGIIILIVVIILAVLAKICSLSFGSAAVSGFAIGASFSGFSIPTDLCSKLQTLGITGAAQKVENLFCQNPQVIAQQKNVTYPFPGNDPNLVRLMSCIESTPGIGELGSRFTYDSNPFCNYSRGDNQYEDTCGACAHSPNSCHYGGSTGTTGSLAVDYGGMPGAGNEGIVGPKILQTAVSCASSLGLTLKRNTCEDSSGAAVACSASGATHTHTSIAPCSGDSGPINTR